MNCYITTLTMPEISRQKSPICTHEVNFSDIGGTEHLDDQMRLRSALEALGLYGENYLYCSVPPNQKGMVSRTGTNYGGKGSEDKIFACKMYSTEDGSKKIGDDPYSGANDIFSYFNNHAEGFKHAVLVVYRAEHFKNINPTEWRFKDPSKKLNSVAGIVQISNYWQRA